MHPIWESYLPTYPLLLGVRGSEENNNDIAPRIGYTVLSNEKKKGYRKPERSPRLGDKKEAKDMDNKKLSSSMK